MTGTSKIEWTEQTWNPIVGCSIVSPGCTNCYAMKMAARIEAMGNQPRYSGTTRKVNGNAVWTGKIAQAPDSALLAPLRRKKPTTYFVNSMSDLFHQDVPDEWIDRVFAVMALAPQHTFQVLTKRAARMREYMAAFGSHRLDNERMYEIDRQVDLLCADTGKDRFEASGWPLPNVWLGVSTERQQEADERIPHLLETPAAVRFISAEPLLGPIYLTSNLGGTLWIGGQRGCGGMHRGDGSPGCPRELHHHHDDRCGRGLDWVIAGGESGTGARSIHPDWARSLRDQCATADVAFFFKQWGNWAPSTPEQAAGNPRSGWKAIAAYPHVAKADELYPEAGAAFVEHMTKAAAGRLLDGELHDGMPRTVGAGAKP